MVLLLVVLGAAPVQGVDGGLTLAQVQAHIEWHSPEINACLAGSPKRASVRYRFSVKPDGRVGQFAFVNSERVESPRITCVGGALEKWRFAASDGGAVVQWDFAVSSIDAGVPSRAEQLAPAEFAPRWVDEATSCYDATKPGEQREGLASVEVIALASGDVVEARTLDVTAALADTTLAACLQEHSLRWSLTPSAHARRVELRFAFARSERRVKGLLMPSAPAREIVAFRAIGGAEDAKGLPKTVIHEEIKRWSPRIRACYEFGLTTNHSLAGKVKVAFVIGPDGSVVHSEAIEVTLPSEQVTDCILQVVNKGTFPPPEGRGIVNVTFPWIFQTEEAGEGPNTSGPSP